MPVAVAQRVRDKIKGKLLPKREELSFGFWMIEASNQLLKIIRTSGHQHKFVSGLFAFCIGSFHAIIIEQTAKDRF